MLFEADSTNVPFESVAGAEDSNVDQGCADTLGNLDTRQGPLPARGTADREGRPVGPSCSLRFQHLLLYHATAPLTAVTVPLYRREHKVQRRPDTSLRPSHSRGPGAQPSQRTPNYITLTAAWTGPLRPFSIISLAAVPQFTL